MGLGFAAQNPRGPVVAGLRNRTRDMKETILSGLSGTHGARNCSHAASRSVWKLFISNQRGGVAMTSE